MILWRNLNVAQRWRRISDVRAVDVDGVRISFHMIPCLFRVGCIDDKERGILAKLGSHGI